MLSDQQIRQNEMTHLPSRDAPWRVRALVNVHSFISKRPFIH